MRTRFLLRDFVTYGTLLIVLVVLLAVAWLSRNTDSVLVERASSWPVVGEYAKRFRARYLPPEPGPEEDEEMVLRFGVNEAGLEVASVSMLDASRLRTDRSTPLGDEPLPTLPLPGREADVDRLARARQGLTGAELEGSLGAYELYTDVDDAEVLSFLNRVARGVEASYVERYQLTPVGRAAETIVLYRREADYRAVQDTWGEIRGLGSHGHTGYGLVLVYVGSRPTAEVGITLVHELAHLLNRRAIGPALPPWLDEGIADDLSQCRTDDSGRLILGTLAEVRTDFGETYELRQGLAALSRVAMSLAAGDRVLPRVVNLDRQEFLRSSDSGLHYAESAFLVRCFLADECGSKSAAAFRFFLRAISNGEAADSAALQASIGGSWSEIEADLRRFIERWSVAEGLAPPG